MTQFTEAQKRQWVAWLESYGARKFLDHFMQNAHGAQGECTHCGEPIFLDLLEGGGVADWRMADGDYGCGDSPETTEDGTGGHLPIGVVA